MVYRSDTEYQARGRRYEAVPSATAWNLCQQHLAQNTLRPRDRLRCRLLTTVYILLENVLSKILRPLANGAVNGRAASVYFGL